MGRSTDRLSSRSGGQGQDRLIGHQRHTVESSDAMSLRRRARAGRFVIGRMVWVSIKPRRSGRRRQQRGGSIDRSIAPSLGPRRRVPVCERPIERLKLAYQSAPLTLRASPEVAIDLPSSLSPPLFSLLCEIQIDEGRIGLRCATHPMLARARDLAPGRSRRSASIARCPPSSARAQGPRSIDRSTLRLSCRLACRSIGRSVDPPVDRSIDALGAPLASLTQSIDRSIGRGLALFFGKGRLLLDQSIDRSTEMHALACRFTVQVTGEASGTL